jgi:polygalacturonase
MSLVPPGSSLGSVRDHGAVGDGRAADGRAIQAAIDAAGSRGGGTVVLPPGGYVSGSIFLRSGVTLWLDSGAVLLGSRDPRDYPLVESRWEGSTRMTHAGLVHARGEKNIAVLGRGRVDGRGEEWWRAFREGSLEHPRPRLFALEDCEDVLLEGFTAVNSPAWTINPVRSRNVRIHGLSITNPPDSPNTDGINPDSCRSVRISDCFVSVGDDCITIKSGTELERPDLRMACEDIVVTNCVLERGHGGVVIGSEMSGGVRNVAVSNCVFKGTDRGLRMKTRRGRGGTVERVRVSNIVMYDVLCPFALNMHYHCGGKRGDPVVGDRGALPPDEGTPAFRDISYNAISAVGARIAAAFVDGLAEAPVERLSFTDVSVEMSGEDEPVPPEMADGLPPLSRAGFVATHVRGLRMSAFRVSGHRGEAFALVGCEDVEMDSCSPR